MLQRGHAVIGTMPRRAAGAAGGGAGSSAYFKDKTIRLMVGSAPGGGYDAYGRLFAAHIRRHIPGNPTVIVQNMPGAGSLVLANYLYNVAPKDGTAFGAVNALLATDPLIVSGAASSSTRGNSAGSAAR